MSHLLTHDVIAVVPYLRFYSAFGDSAEAPVQAWLASAGKRGGRISGPSYRRTIYAARAVH